MTTITQSISSLGTVPTTADPDNFDANADAFLGTALPLLRTEINTWAGQANTVAGEVNTNATTATTQAGIATTQAGLAAASAASALAAPGTNATSTTSLAIGTGSKTFTIQTGKSFVVGMAMLAAETADPTTNYMWGQVTSYNSGTGELILNVTETAGSGTIASWTISISPNPAAVAPAILGVDRGGTGAASLTANNLLLGNGTSAVQFVAPGTSGNVLTSNGTTWASVAGVSPGMVLLATASASSSATIEFTDLDTDYDRYVIHLDSVLPGTNSSAFWIRLSADNGSTFISSASYFYNFIQNSAGTVSGNPDDGATKIAPAAINVLNTSGTAAATGVNGTISLSKPGTTRYQQVDAQISFVQSGTRQGYAAGAGTVDSGSGNTVTAIQFLFSTGNILSGKFRVYGIRSAL